MGPGVAKYKVCQIVTHAREKNNREGAEGVLGWETILNRVDKEGLSENSLQKLLAEQRR